MELNDITLTGSGLISAMLRQACAGDDVEILLLEDDGSII